MAVSKTKGTDKRLKELKGIKPEKITKDQLEKVQNIVNKLNRVQIEIGTLEVRKHDMMHQAASVRDALSVLQSEFEKDYGTIDIDIHTGVINYPDNGKAN